METEIVTVTVVMPVYNGEGSISSAIDSVLIQSGCKVELVVIDDGSTDKTREVIDRYRTRVKAINQKNKGSKGLGVTRNFGVKCGIGSWIAFLDHDDVWYRDKLITQIEYALANGYDMVYTNARNVGDIDQVSEFAYVREDMVKQGGIFKDLLCNNFIFTSSVIIKREVFEKLNGFTENPKIVQDWDLWLRVAGSGFKIGGLYQPLIDYSWRKGSVSKSHLESHNRRMSCVHAALKSDAGKGIGFQLRRKVISNAYATSAWFCSEDDIALSIKLYVLALLSWPVRVCSIKGLVKGLNIYVFSSKRAMSLHKK